MVQQRDGAVPPLEQWPGLDSRKLESDADTSAVGAISFLFGTTTGLLGRSARPRKRSGPRLQRCGKSAREKEVERLGGLQIGFMEQQRKQEEDRLKKGDGRRCQEKRTSTTGNRAKGGPR